MIHSSESIDNSCALLIEQKHFKAFFIYNELMLAEKS